MKVPLSDVEGEKGATEACCMTFCRGEDAPGKGETHCRASLSGDILDRRKAKPLDYHLSMGGLRHKQILSHTCLGSWQMFARH